MKRALIQITRGTALVVVLSLGLFVVASSILKSVGWSLPDILKSAFTSISELLTPRRGDEVQNYVLFTEVKQGNRKVVTGIEYATSSNRSIESQWCYLTSNGKSGGVVLRLPLATVSKTGVKTVSPFTPSALSQFDLNATAATALVKSYCRFQ